MSAKTRTCPHCDDQIEIDLSAGASDCPACGVPIELERRQKRVRKRTGMRFGKTVYGVSAEGAALEAPKPAGFLGKGKKRRESSSDSSDSSDGEKEDDSDVSGTQRINRTRTGRKSRQLRNIIILVSALVILSAIGIFAYRFISPFLEPPKVVDAGTLGQISSSPSASPARGDLRVSEVYDRITEDIMDENVTSRLKSVESGAKDRGGAPTPEDFSDAKKVAEQFLSATTVEERKRFIRDVGTHADAISAHYDKNGDGPYDFESFSTLGVQDQNDNFTAFQVKTQGEPSRMIGLEKTSTGYLVDWASWVLYSEMDWMDFIAAKPVSSTLFRILAKKSDYYNFAFSDSDVFQCYQLSSPNSDSPSLYGYVRLGSDLANELKGLDDVSNGKPLPLVLNLRYPPGQEIHNMVVIDELVSNGWFIREASGSSANVDTLKGDL